MIKLKCHCGSEVEVSFSYTPAAHEKESDYANNWMRTHECKFARGGLITAPSTIDNETTLTPYKTGKLLCGGSISVTTQPNTYVVNIGGDASNDDPPLEPVG